MNYLGLRTADLYIEPSTWNLCICNMKIQVYKYLFICKPTGCICTINVNADDQSGSVYKPVIELYEKKPAVRWMIEFK